MDTVQCASSAQAWPHVHQGACAATILVCSGFTHTLTPVQPPRSVLWKVVYPVPTSTLSPWWGDVYSVPTHTFTPLVGVGGSPLCHSVKMRFGRAAERPRVPKRSLWDGPVSDPKARTPNSQCSSKLADASGHMAYLPLAWNFEASL